MQHSPLRDQLDQTFLCNASVGVFHVLGETDTGELHLCVLNQAFAANTTFKLDLGWRLPVTNNCCRYRVVTELGTPCGAFFVTESAKTHVSSWYCLINNSRYGKRDGADILSLDDQVKPFHLLDDYEGHGCFVLYNDRGDVCIVSTIFDHSKFTNLDLTPNR